YFSLPKVPTLCTPSLRQSLRTPLRASRFVLRELHWEAPPSSWTAKTHFLRPRPRISLLPAQCQDPNRALAPPDCLMSHTPVLPLLVRRATSQMPKAGPLCQYSREPGEMKTPARPSRFPVLGLAEAEVEVEVEVVRPSAAAEARPCLQQPAAVP